MDDAPPRVEQEQHVVRVLADLVAVPEERLRNAARRAARERLDVFRLRRIHEVLAQVFLHGARPRLEGNLSVDRIAHAAGRAIFALALRSALAAIAGRAALGIGEVVVIARWCWTRSPECRAGRRAGALPVHLPCVMGVTVFSRWMPLPAGACWAMGGQGERARAGRHVQAVFFMIGEDYFVSAGAGTAVVGRRRG